nr:MAG TPA: hypothetical protein [Caudoviricetes sp.]
MRTFFYAIRAVVVFTINDICHLVRIPPFNGR